jgi:hypothetical protein
MGWTDSHLHEIILEKNEYINPKLDIAFLCLEGQRACPPEDVGGVPGYSEFCHALLDPNHAEHARLNQWSGDNYHFEHFDLAMVNWELIKYLRC